MSGRVTLHCERDQLDSFLKGDLSSEAESAVVQHLDVCEKCRRALEDSAGGAAWCSEVHETLADPDRPEASDSMELTRWDSSVASRHSSDRRGSRALAEQALAALQSCLGPTDDPRMMGRIGGYEVAGIIGRGAAGIVVKAFQPALNRFVAIKVLAPELAVNAAARQRFEREAQAAAAVVHEHVVPIYAVEEYQGTPFLVMQYVSGGSLEHRIADEGILSPAAALRIGMQIASGLAAAHGQGLIHRDIKPANILLESGLERVLITDFGLARAVDDATLTHSGFVAGTPQFMSPEQARGEGIDHRTDLFSLGSVLYTLLAGRPPFRSETAYGLLRRICDEPHRRLIEVNSGVPLWLSAIVDRLLAKDADERFSTASEVESTLRAGLAHVQNPLTCELPADVRRWARASKRSTKVLRRVGWSLLAATAITATAWLAPLPWTKQNPTSTTRLPAPPSWEEIDRGLQETRSQLAIAEDTASRNEPIGPDAWVQELAQIQSLLQQVELDIAGVRPSPVAPPAVRVPSAVEPNGHP